MTYLDIFKETVLAAGYTPDEADRRIAYIKAHNPVAREFFSREVAPEQVPTFRRATALTLEAIETEQKQDPVGFEQRVGRMMAEAKAEKIKN